MKALILAAGFGSRLRPLTNKIPKALVKYKGRELIDYQISVLVSQEIKEITLVVGYQAQILKDFLEKKYSSLQIKIIENKEFGSSNSAFSACKAIQKLDLEDYLHINCDILFSEKILSNIALEDIILFWRNSVRDTWRSPSLSIAKIILRASSVIMRCQAYSFSDISPSLFMSAAPKKPRVPLGFPRK